MLNVERARPRARLALPSLPAWLRLSLRVSPIMLSLLFAAGIGLIVFLRSLDVWSADGDPALHLRLIKDIAATWRLPEHLPHYPARIVEGGAVEAMFPYGYTPLYHVTGAAAYSFAGVEGVLAINAAGAAAIAYVIVRFVARTTPIYVAMAAAVCAGLSPRVQMPFTSIYMEAMVLGLVFLFVWTLYLALARRSPLQGLLAGAIMGLAVATRQSALVYGMAVSIVVGLHLMDRRLLRRPCGAELRVLLAAGAGFAAVAFPALVYLWSVTGSVGYGDMKLPGTDGAVPIDPIANGYVAGITKPDASIFTWFDRFERILFFGERWLPVGAFGVLIVFFAAGIVHLHSRGRAARFFARWVAVQFLVDLAIFVTLHGNSRYIILSQMLFYAIVPVGAYAIVRWSINTGRTWPRMRLPLAIGAAALLALGAFVLSPPGYLAQYREPVDPLRAFRARAYADAGAWANEHTTPDSLFLVPRVYSAELTWERSATWVTFYGNYWAVEAIEEGDPARAHAILADHGVDYVVIQDPPGTYLDRMPGDGMRSFLQLGTEASPYFSLAYVTDDEEGLSWQGRQVYHGLRIYRVTPAAELHR